jgi:hypothetical protein
VTKEEGMRRERDVALVTLYPLFSVTEITGSLKDTIHVFLKDYSDEKITHFALPRRKNEIKKALEQLLQKKKNLVDFFFYQHQWKTLPDEIDALKEKIRLSRYQVNFSAISDKTAYETKEEAASHYDDIIKMMEDYKINMVNLLERLDNNYKALERNSVERTRTGKLVRRVDMKDDPETIKKKMVAEEAVVMRITNFYKAFDRDIVVPDSDIIDDGGAGGGAGEAMEIIEPKVVVDEEDGDGDAMITEESKINLSPVRNDKRYEVELGLTEAQLRVFKASEKYACTTGRMFGLSDALAEHGKAYLMGCNIVMHMQFFTVLGKIIDNKDIYMRNLFETGTGGGCMDKGDRAGWETKIFASPEYDKFEPHEKVKYAALNVAHKKTGIPRADHYGKSHLVMADHVKNRITLTYGDSCSKTQLDVGTLSCPGNVLNAYTTAQKKYLSDPTRWKEETTPFDRADTPYTEVQIHGELIFSRDVKLFRFSKGINHGTFMPKLDQFFEIIGRKIPFEFI